MSIDSEQVQRVVDLHKQGLGRNAVARELSISHRQVDNAARVAGIEWGRENVRARHGRRLQAQAQRESIAAAWRDLAESQLEAVARLSQEGGATGEMKERALIAAIACDKEIALEAVISRHTAPMSDADLEALETLESTPISGVM